LVFNVQGREVGLLASPPVDAKEVDLAVDEKTLRQTGISGSAIIDGSTTLLVDIYELVKTLNPSWFREDSYANTQPRKRDAKNGQGEKKILLVEDSDFFRAQVKKYLQDEGYNVVEAEDGQVAWEYLNQNAEEIALVVTDLEMPNMDGFELAKHIRAEDRFQNYPVIALTSLADKEDMQKGKEVGIDDYQIKLDKEKLLHSVAHYFQEIQTLA
jgi:two-component system chemotaxis sensor kinase CheA